MVNRHVGDPLVSAFWVNVLAGNLRLDADGVWARRSRGPSSPGNRMALISGASNGAGKTARTVIRLSCIKSQLSISNGTLAVGRVQVDEIVGAVAIFRAAGNDYPIAGQAASFADLYLRHPKSVLAEPSVLFSQQVRIPDHRDERGRNYQFRNWLDVFLADSTSGRGVTIKTLQEVIDLPISVAREQTLRALQRDSDAVVRFRTTWRSFVDPLTLSQGGGTDRLLTDRERASMRRIASHLDTLIDELRSAVEQRVNEAWEKCFEAAAATGFSLLRRDPTRKRNIPAITFHRPHFIKAREFFEILQVHTPLDYPKLINELRNIEETGYLYYLAFAAVFAAEGKWRVTLILTRRAITIAERENPSMISGREAYYLNAVARRTIAQSEGDLDRAWETLREARRALERELAVHAAHRVTNLRFDTEEVSLTLSRYLLRRFGGIGPEAARNSIEIILPLPTQITRLLTRLKEEHDLRIRRAVFRTLNITLFQIVVFLYDNTKSDNTLLNKYSGNFKELEKDIADHSSPNTSISYLHEAVLLTARCLFSSPARGRDQRLRRQEIEQFFSTPLIDSNSVTRYDHQRFQFFRTFSLKSLANQ